MSKRTIMKVCYLLLIVFLLVSCKKSPITVPETNDNNSKQTGVETTNTSDKQAIPQYFFINGRLLGGYINKEWKSLCNTGEHSNDAADFFVKDILAQNEYHIYKDRKNATASRQILWSTADSGLGSFEREGVSKKLEKYSELYSTTEGYSGFDRIFNLPVTAGEDLLDLKIPDYAFITEFVVENKVVFEYELATNSDTDPFPREIYEDSEATTEGIQALTNLFKENKMENTVPNFTKCIKSDFDNDRSEEYLMFAENPRSESGNPVLCSSGKTENLGIFNAVFYQDDNGSIQTLYSDMRSYKYPFKPDKDNKMELMQTGPELGISIDLLTIADLNADGVYEIGIRKGEWEHGFDMVYAMDARGKYEIVMRSDWGM